MFSHFTKSSLSTAAEIETASFLLSAIYYGELFRPVSENNKWD